MSDVPEAEHLTVDNCVIGSGFGGLSIARELEASGSDYVVLDKGRTPGGRAATRRFAESRFDHGLPLLTDQGPLTRDLIEEGVLLRLDPDRGEGWFARAGISALGKHLAADLKVRNRVRVTGIEPHDGPLRLNAETEDGNVSIGVRRRLFVTAPLPQALELVASLEPDWSLPSSAPFHKCVVAMVRIERNQIPDGAFIRQLSGGNGQLVLECLKFPDVEPGISLRFSPEVSDELFDQEDASIREFVSESLVELIGPVSEERIQLMKWRYANSSGVLSVPYLATTAGEVDVVVCGDAFSDGAAAGLEATLKSCLAACEALKARDA